MELNHTRRFSGQRLRAVGLVAASLLVITGCASTTAKEGPEELQVFSVGSQGSIFIAQVAQAQGFLKEEGLKLEEVQTSNPAAGFAAMAQGQLDAVNSPPNLVLSNNAENPDQPIAILEAMNVSDFNIVVSPDSGVKQVTKDGFDAAIKSMRGKIFGVPAIGGSLDFQLRQVLIAGGLNPEKDVEIITVKYGLPAISALQAKQIDGYTFASEFVAQAVDDGSGIVAFGTTHHKLPPDLGWLGEFMSGSLTVSAKDYDAKPDRYDAFARAIEKAKKFVVDPANAKAVAKMVVDHYGMSAKAADYYLKHGASTIATPLTCELTESTYSTMVDLKIVPGPAPSCEKVSRGPGVAR
jgi:ABC-type nitrate/sulfonate/bicarbonate transport system substrate-binding protein